MAGTASSKLAAIFVLVPVGILLWFLAPMALPVWRWRYMDFQQLSLKTKQPVALLQHEYMVSMRYNPRGTNDPCPWQIVSMDPAWASVDDRRADEDHELIRCTFISERDGTPPSKLFLGSGSYKDRFWKAKVWRFPPGTFGMNPHRPVVVYRGDTYEHWDLGTCEVLNADCLGVGTEKYENDDNKDDGYTRGGE